MSASPDLSIVVPSRHRNEMLANCLEKLAPGVQTLPPERYEVIVSDDGTATSAETLVRERFPWARWAAGPRRGPAANRNHGASHALAEWLVFTDDDCLPDAQWLATYADMIRTYLDLEVLEGRVYVDRPQNSLAETAPLNEHGGAFWSCNFAIKRQLFVDLGGFDESYRYAAMEDADLKLRLMKSGRAIKFVEQAAVLHPWRLLQGWPEFYRHYQATITYLSKHPAESSKINSAYYFRVLFRTALFELGYKAWQMQGRGLRTVLLKYLSWIYAGVALAFRPQAHGRQNFA